MAFHDLFSKHAQLYADARPVYPVELFEFIAEQAPARERAWDCATGSGQAAVGLAHRFDRVCASDASAEQIAHARACTNVTYSVQAAERCAFADDCFDAICVAQALHWFDHPRFFAEAERTLKPGGVFVAFGYDWMRVTPAFDAVFERAILAPLKIHWAPQNALLWNGYRDVRLPFRRIDAPPVSMRMRWSLPQLLTYVRSWSAAQRCVQAGDGAVLNTAADELAIAWAAPADEARDVEMRLHIIASRKA